MSELSNNSKFSPEDDEKLVDEIKQFKFIYDQDDEDYKNVLLKGEIWEKISNSLGKDVTECKKRWKGMRDNYSKNKRRLHIATSSGSSWQPTWPLYSRLYFLDNFRPYVETNLQTNSSDGHTFDEIFKQEDVSEKDSELLIKRLRESSEDLNDKTDIFKYSPASVESFSSSQSVKLQSSSSSQRAKKLRQPSPVNEIKFLSEIYKSICVEEDDVDIFMKSIALSVKKLPQHLIPIAKMKILSAVTDLQYPQKTEFQYPPQNIDAAVQFNSS